MSKKHLILGDLKISSFITSLDQDIQKTLLGGNTFQDTGDQSRLRSCPSKQDPLVCDSTFGVKCDGIITDNDRCQEILN